MLFPDVRGLEPGGAVFVSGVERGRVDAIELAPEGVRVRLSLAEEVLLPQDSRFVIDSGGLLGESRINIQRGRLGPVIQPGGQVDGEIPPSFDDVIGRLEKDLDEVRQTFVHINSIIGDSDVQAGLRRSVQSLPLLLEEGRTMVGQIERTAEAYRALADDIGREIALLGGEIGDIARSIQGVLTENEENLHSALANLDSFLARLDRILADFDADGQSGKELRQAVVNLSRAADEIRGLAADLGEELMGAPEGGESTLDSLRSAATKADKLLGDVQSIRFGGTVALHQAYSGLDDGTRLADLDLELSRVGSPWRLILAGEDIGGDDQFSALLGYPLLEGLDLSAGLVRGEPGGGLTFRLSPWGLPLSVRWRWWDADGGAWSLEERLHFDDRWGLFHRRLEESGAGRDSVGLFYRF